MTKGGEPKNPQPAVTAVRAPSGPQHGLRPTGTETTKAGPNPFVVAAAAFGLGTLLAKAIDWRGHSHPRR